jgi:WD40 repeat protein
LEIEPTPTPEECLAIAFHPSGLHLVVALNDKIQLMNLHADKLRPDKIWPTRNCYDIKFSHGGHMFAAVSNKDIHVHNFYTNDCPDSMMYSGHMQRVNRIDWFENDMGFVSCSSDGGIYFYDLYTHTLEKQKRNLDKDFNDKGAKYLSVVNVPNKPYEVVAVGTDRQVTSNVTSATDKSRALDAYLSEVCMMKSGRAVIAGVGEPGRPGELQVWKFPLERTLSVQAHSKAVTRLRLSHDNSWLYTTGADGIICIFEVKDKDPRAVKRDETFHGAGNLLYSEEILTDKSRLEALMNE